MPAQKISWSIAGLLVAGAAAFFLWPTAPKSISNPSSAVSAPFGSGSLLDEVSPKTSETPEAEPSGAVPTTAQLEKQVRRIHENQEQLDQIKLQSMAAMRTKDLARAKSIEKQGQPLVSLLNLRLSALQTDLESARRARPNDPAVQWLTGELLLMVGGEPEEIRPYFERAEDAGLKNAQFYTSFAKVEYDLNHFQSAYDYARKALKKDEQSQTAWNTYMRAAFALEDFGEVADELDHAFPGMKPPWAVEMSDKAQDLLLLWRRELAFRQAEKKKATEPIVQLTIEHRSFNQDEQKVGERSTGRGEVQIELFEDQAPLAVANFVNLVERGFYNGTRFYWSEAGRMVVGGDPNTKGQDRAEDGEGGPGYSIPDEFNSPNAREHFRGSLSMVERGPDTGGSQFFISLVPIPEYNGHFTVFGRVISGQEVVDKVTPGRTNREVGNFGKIIPGDLLVRAEVIRKRAHPYEVTKAVP